MYCTKLFESLDRRLDEGKSIDQIADELCENVKDGRSKVVRLIKNLHGSEYLIKNAEVLKFNPSHIKKSSSKKTDDTSFQKFKKCFSSMNLKDLDFIIFRHDGSIEGIGEKITIHNISPIIFEKDFMITNIRGFNQFLSKFPINTRVELKDNSLKFIAQDRKGNLKVQLLEEKNIYFSDDFKNDVELLKEKYDVDFYVVIKNKNSVNFL